jgi:hypothetical protein
MDDLARFQPAHRTNGGQSPVRGRYLPHLSWATALLLSLSPTLHGHCRFSSSRRLTDGP